MNIQFVGLPSPIVAQIRTTRRDAYGGEVERHTTDDGTYPCRHCLGQIPAGQDYLILAHRPFQSRNPYAETGPIFLCAADCPAHVPSDKVPDILRAPNYLVRGYTAQERIVYGTGKVTPTSEIADYARQLLDMPEIAFVDVRSASNNCFQCRIVPVS